MLKLEIPSTYKRNTNSKVYTYNDEFTIKSICFELQFGGIANGHAIGCSSGSSSVGLIHEVC